MNLNQREEKLDSKQSLSFVRSMADELRIFILVVPYKLGEEGKV